MFRAGCRVLDQIGPTLYPIDKRTPRARDDPPCFSYGARIVLNIELNPDDDLVWLYLKPPGW